MEIFCRIKPKSKSNIWAQSIKKAMLDVRLIYHFLCSFSGFSLFFSNCYLFNFVLASQHQRFWNPDFLGGFQNRVFKTSSFKSKKKHFETKVFYTLRWLTWQLTPCLNFLSSLVAKLQYFIRIKNYLKEAAAHYATLVYKLLYFKREKGHFLVYFHRPNMVFARILITLFLIITCSGQGIGWVHGGHDVSQEKKGNCIMKIHKV